MLTSAEVAFDEQRFQALSRHWYAQVQPNAGLSGEYAMNVRGGRPGIMLGNPSNISGFSAQVLLRRDRGACWVLIRDAKIENLSFSLDGTRPDGGAPFPIANIACDPHSRITLSGAELTSTPRTMRHLSWRPRISVHSATGHAMSSDVALMMLPLPFRPLSAGPHVLRFSYPAMFAKSGWSDLEDAITSKPALPSQASSAVTNTGGTQWLTFTSAKPGTILRHIALRAPLAGDHFEIVGTIVAPRYSKVQVTLVHPGANEFIFDSPGGGTSRDYHIDLFRYARHAGDQLYVLYYPPPRLAGTARVSVAAIQGMAANLIVSEHPFPAGQELQLQPTDLGMNRYLVAGLGRVVQYDQTYDDGWRLSDSAEHYESTSGFNVWVRRDRPDTATISFRTGVGYALGVAFSLVAFCVLGLLSTRFPLRRKRST
jgi:hypothetical protein